MLRIRLTLRAHIERWSAYRGPIAWRITGLLLKLLPNPREEYAIAVALEARDLYLQGWARDQATWVARRAACKAWNRKHGFA